MRNDNLKSSLEENIMSAKHFTLSSLTPQASDNVNDSQVPIKHVVAEFARLSTRGEYLAAKDNKTIQKWRYTRLKKNNGGVQNHFQGIQRLSQSKYFVVSGGDWKTPCSDLFVLKMDSRPKTGPWWSNIAITRKPPDSDGIVTTIELDSKLWHAGGMDVLGDIVAVPLEYSPPGSLDPLIGFNPPDFGNDEASKIIFLNFKNPEKPKIFPFEIARQKEKAGAVALTKLPNNYYLLALWSDSDRHPRRLDFYLSKSINFMDGFQDKIWTWYADDVLAVGEQDRNFSNFQVINFLRQEDEKFYLLGLHNTSAAAPAIPGKDYADLFAVDIPSSALKSIPKVSPDEIPNITKVGNLKVECKHRQCNFDAGAGAYIDRGKIIIYSIYHWRTGEGLIRFNEFRSPIREADSTVTNKNAWLEMYDETYFEGRRLGILGTAQMTVPNFDEVYAQGTGFEDKTSSIRYQLPKNSKCLLYEHKDYTKKLSLELKGNGQIEELTSLSDKIEGKISSIKFLTHS